MNLVKFAPVYHRNRTFAHLWNHVQASNEQNGENVNFNPSVNILQTPEGFRIDMALAGYGKEEVALKVTEGLLTITGTKQAETLAENSEFTRREFHIGNFERLFQLPKFLDTEKVQANFQNGLLQVSLPRREESMPKAPRTVEIV